MKKVLFLMLFLTIVGTASLTAQVRIGGNEDPHRAAVLDLNATDVTNSGTKALALPRVNLSSTADKLGNATLLDGMLVYNTGSGVGEGLYYWLTDKWIKLAVEGASLTIVADLNQDYTVKATDDVLLFKATAVRNITMPTTGVSIGKKLYITDMDGGQGIAVANPEVLYNGSYNFIYGGTSQTYMFVGGGKWISISGY